MDRFSCHLNRLSKLFTGIKATFKYNSNKKLTWIEKHFVVLLTNHTRKIEKLLPFISFGFNRTAFLRIARGIEILFLFLSICLYVSTWISFPYCKVVSFAGVVSSRHQTWQTRGCCVTKPNNSFLRDNLCGRFRFWNSI